MSKQTIHDSYYGKSPITSVDRRSKISRRELIKEYIEPSIPVILTDAATEWNALGKFTPSFFKEKYGHLQKEVKGVNYNMSEFVDMMMSSTEANPSPYPFNLNIEKYFPELLNDIKPEIIYGKIDRVNHPLFPRFMLHGTDVYEVFLGGAGSSFPVLHIDALCLHNQATLVYGSKEFILYSPDQIDYMYPSASYDKYSNVNILNPDYEKYPLFKKAHPIRVMVNEGETILFPTGWWHSTAIYEPCISVGRIQLNAANWRNFLKDEYKIWRKRSLPMSLSILLYGEVLGAVMDLQETFFSA